MPQTLLLTIGADPGTPVFAYDSNGNANAIVAFKSGMNVDADGSPHAYKQDNTGLDDLACAGHAGNWWGIATENGQPDGVPVIQGDGDPAPGYYVSTTALMDGTKKQTDPACYVDSESIPYIVLPPQVEHYCKLGDVGVAYNTAAGQNSYFICADIGPRDQIGEGSIILAKNLGVPPSPRNGGVGEGIVYVVFPHTGDGKVKTVDEISALADGFLAANDLSAVLADFGIAV